MNPKSITMGELYGEEDPLTMEWKDGLMPKEFFENFKSLTPILQGYTYIVVGSLYKEYSLVEIKL